MKQESEAKQDRPAATLDDLVALVERAAQTITQLQSEIARCNERIEELEQSEAASAREAEKWREVMQLVRQHGSVTVSLNQPEATAPRPNPSMHPPGSSPAGNA
jgi:FtsZ-binding cell division protein ZapB